MRDPYGNWAQVYDFFYPDRSDEIDFWARWAAAGDGRVLDLMCGTAEVSLGLARRGFRVLGVDRSVAMLAAGAARLSAAADYPAHNLSLAQGDACAIPAADDAFDLALVGGLGSFNHLDGAAAAITLGELARVLSPGGVIGLELVNPALLPELPPTQTVGPLRPPPPGVSLQQTVSRRYEQRTGACHIEQVTRYESADTRHEFRQSFVLHVRQAAEIRAMLADAGFVGMQAYGDHSTAAYSPWSFALLVLATRRS